MAAVTMAPTPVGLQYPVAEISADPQRWQVAPPAPPPVVDPAVERAESINTLISALGSCANPLPKKQRVSIARSLHDESAAHGYDPLFITALMQVESGCLPTAVGGEAIGLTQMLPSTGREVARRVGLPWRGARTLTEPAASLQLGVQYLRELEDMFDDPYKAMAAYNMGPGRVMRMSSSRAQRTAYVRKVLTRYEQLLDRYA
jgi:soluble lytic murein transglycosylase-like protein